MVICTLLILLWVAYAIAFTGFLGYLTQLPPTPILHPRDIGLFFVFLFALIGWIAFTAFAIKYIYFAEVK